MKAPTKIICKIEVRYLEGREWKTGGLPFRILSEEADRLLATGEYKDCSMKEWKRRGSHKGMPE